MQEINISPLEKFTQILQNPQSKVFEKYLAIFELKSLNTRESVQSLIDNFENLDNSDLLKHEVTYALGQLDPNLNEQIKPFLIQVIEQENEYPVVRHEAAEGLSNFAQQQEDLVSIIEKYTTSKVNELKYTCEIGLQKLKSYKDLKQKYGLQFAGTKEPAAPFQVEDFQKELNQNLYENIKQYCLDDQNSLFNKYRAIYLLRNIGDESSVRLLSELLNKKYWNNTNNLFRHEICFVLGQISENASIAVEQLKQTIEDTEENEIVRHEAISAFSSIVDDKNFFQKFFDDESRIVRESAIVAVGLMDYWKNR